MKTMKRWTALCLSFLMLLTVSVTALAEDVEETTSATEVVAALPDEEIVEAPVEEVYEEPAEEVYEEEYEDWYAEIPEDVFEEPDEEVFRAPADATEEEPIYQNYVSIGDSCGSGVGLPYYLQLVKEFGQKWITCTEIEGSYPALVAEAVGAEDYRQFHFPGARTADIRYLLDENFRTDWIIEGQEMYLSEGTISKEEMDAHRDEVVEAVKNADLITLDVGLNDYWLPVIAAIYDIAGEGRLDGGKLTVPELVTRFGSIGALVENALSFTRAWVMHPLQVPGYIMKLMNALYKWLVDYQLNISGILKQIYKLNPNATVVVCGAYNAVEGWDLFPIGNDRLIEKVMQPFYNLVNLRKKLAVRMYPGNAVYVEMKDVELITDHFTIPLFEFTGVTKFSFNPHPTLEGAQTQAEHILNALGIDNVIE